MAVRISQRKDKNQRPMTETVLRLLVLLLCVLILLPEVSPLQVPGITGKHPSFIITVIGVLCFVLFACLGFGNKKLKQLSAVFSITGVVMMLGGFLVFMLCDRQSIAETEPLQALSFLPFAIFAGISLIFLVCTFVWLSAVNKLQTEEKIHMEEKYCLFLMLLPILIGLFVFYFLPLYGWRYVFFDHSNKDAIQLVGFKWFIYLFENKAALANVLNVLRNTLIMSGLHIAFSWLPVVLALLLTEVKSPKFKSSIQTITLLPHFVSWMVIFAVATAVFSSDGFINIYLNNTFGYSAYMNYLESSNMVWLNMLLWDTWKTTGWSMLIYFTCISRMDQELFDAAKVDGASRFECVRYITLPHLLPLYVVMLLLNITNILSTGMEQYLVFQNEYNGSLIQVMDLYVYNMAFGDDSSGWLPLATVISMIKTVVWLLLLFVTSKFFKKYRIENHF